MLTTCIVEPETVTSCGPNWAALSVYFGLLSQKGLMAVTKKETEQIKRLFGIVAEDLRSDVRQVAEGVALLNERFDGLEGRFDGLEGRFDGLEGRFDGLEGRFDGLEGRFDGLEGRFDGLEGRFDGLEQKVDRTGRELTVEIRQVGAAQSDLRVRVERLESRRD